MIGLEWERCSHPFLPLHAGLFLFSESRRFLAERMGRGEGGGERTPESGYNVSPVSENRTPWPRPWPGFLQQKKNGLQMVTVWGLKAS